MYESCGGVLVIFPLVTHRTCLSIITCLSWTQICHSWSAFPNLSQLFSSLVLSFLVLAPLPSSPCLRPQLLSVSPSVSTCLLHKSIICRVLRCVQELRISEMWFLPAGETVDQIMTHPHRGVGRGKRQTDRYNKKKVGLCWMYLNYLSIYIFLKCFFRTQYDWRAAAGITGCRARQFLDKVLAFIWYVCVLVCVRMQECLCGCKKKYGRWAANCKNRQKLHGRLTYKMWYSGWQTGQTSSASPSVCLCLTHTHVRTHSQTVILRNGIWRQT